MSTTAQEDPPVTFPDRGQNGAGRSADLHERSGPGNPAHLLLRWLPRLLFGLLLLMLAQLFAGRGINADAWMHIRIGHEFLDGWKPWDPGTLSAFESNDWHSTQWLSQVWFGVLADWRGPAAVLAWCTLMVIAVLLAVHQGVRRWASPWLAAALTTLVLFSCLPWLSARPQVASILLSVVVARAWLETLEDRRVRWWMVPLFWLWAMLHGMWPLGLGLGVAAVVGLAADRRLDRAALVRLAGLVLACGAVTALTPSGPRLVGAVLQVNSRSGYYSEWGSPDFTWPITIAAALPLAMTVLLLMRRERTSWALVAMTVATAVFLLYSQRTVPVAAVVGSLLLAKVWGDRFPGDALTKRGDRRSARAAAVLAAIVGVAVAFSPSLAIIDEPSWLTARLDTLPKGSVVVTDVELGSTMLHHHPDLVVPVHGYGDMMTLEELDRAMTLDAATPGWLDSLSLYEPVAAVLPVTSPLAYNLTEQSGWTEVEGDGEIVFLTPPAS